MYKRQGQEAATVVIAVNDGEPMENKLIYGSVSGKKVDENLSLIHILRSMKNQGKMYGGDVRPAAMNGRRLSIPV